MQIYRCVLLNNGPRCHPQPDSSSSSLLTPEEGAAAEGNSASLASGAPLDQLLYRSEIAVGSRGDIIMFYNKVFISLIKNYALKFTPGENEVRVHPVYVYTVLQCVYLGRVYCVWCVISPSLSLSLSACSLPLSLLCLPYVRLLPHRADSPDSTPSLCPPTHVSTTQAVPWTQEQFP